MWRPCYARGGCRQPAPPWQKRRALAAGHRGRREREGQGADPGPKGTHSMSLSWWNRGDPADDIQVETIETPHHPERDREWSNDTSGTAAYPGSPSIVFLARPIVMEKLAGEKTGLLPTLNR